MSHFSSLRKDENRQKEAEVDKYLIFNELVSILRYFIEEQKLGTIFCQLFVKEEKLTLLLAVPRRSVALIAFPVNRFTNIGSSQQSRSPRTGLFEIGLSRSSGLFNSNVFAFS